MLGHGRWVKPRCPSCWLKTGVGQPAEQLELGDDCHETRLMGGGGVLPLSFFYGLPLENLFFRLLSLARKLECWKVGCMKTTLDLPEDLVREMKLRAEKSRWPLP